MKYLCGIFLCFLAHSASAGVTPHDPLDGKSDVTITLRTKLVTGACAKLVDWPNEPCSGQFEGRAYTHASWSICTAAQAQAGETLPTQVCTQARIDKGRCPQSALGRDVPQWAACKAILSRKTRLYLKSIGRQGWDRSWNDAQTVPDDHGGDEEP